MPDTIITWQINDILEELTKDQLVESYLEKHPGFDQHSPIPSRAILKNAMQDMLSAAHMTENMGTWPETSKFTHLNDIISSIGWLSQKSNGQFKGESAQLFIDAFVKNPECGFFAKELEFALTTLEKQSPETWTHIQNHAALTALYFERQCIAEDRVRGTAPGTAFSERHNEALLLLLGALGHDIGKVGIHPALLHKSTRIAPDRLKTALAQYEITVTDYPEKAHDIAFLHSANKGKIIFAKERNKEQYPDAALILNIGADYRRGELALTDEKERQRHCAIWERINKQAENSRLSGWLTQDEQKTLTMPKRGTVTDQEMAVIATHDEMSEDFFKAASLPDRFKILPHIVSMDRFRQGKGAAPKLTKEEMKLAHIIHATDELEALLAARSYRPQPLSPDQALHVMKEQASKGLVSRDVIMHLEHNGTLEIYSPSVAPVTLPPGIAKITALEKQPHTYTTMAAKSIG